MAKTVPKTIFRVVSPDRPHPRDLARQAVKAHKHRPSGPVVNVHDRADQAPTLVVDDVLKRSLSDHLGKK